MPKKTAKISDFTGASHVKPPKTARPVLIGDHTELAADPMLRETTGSPAAALATAPVVSRTAKTIQPLGTDIAAAVESEEVPEQVIIAKTPVSETTGAIVKPAEAAAGLPAAKAPEPDPAAGQPSGTTDSIKADDTETLAVPRAEPTDAMNSAAALERAAAAEARQQQLEELIASGKYAVPINAVQRKRSHMFVIEMAILAFVLAIAAADVVLDAGLIQAPDSIPHSHFFSDN